MAKKIALISFVAALVGLAAQFIDWIGFPVWTSFLHIVSVCYIGQELDYGEVNYFSVAFFAVFALSAFLYWRSHSRETRLLRFCLSYPEGNFGNQAKS